MGLLQQLGVDSTALVIFGVISVLHIFLTMIVWKPLYKVLQGRREKTSLAVAEAQRAHEDAETKLKKYQVQMDSAFSEVSKIHEESKTEALAVQDEHVQSGKREQRKLLASARAEAQEEIEKARSELKGELDNLSENIASSILGRGVS